MCTFNNFSEILLWSLLQASVPSARSIQERWGCDRATAYRYHKIVRQFRNQCWNAGIRDLTRLRSTSGG
jgi:hypothetical protein